MTQQQQRAGQTNGMHAQEGNTVCMKRQTEEAHLEVVLRQEDQQCLPAQAIDCGSLHVGLQEQARQVGQAGEAQS